MTKIDEFNAIDTDVPTDDLVSVLTGDESMYVLNENDRMNV